MVLDRAAGAVRHETIAGLPGLLRGGDLLVFNDVRVRPARLRGRLPTGGATEIVLLGECGEDVWECFGKPAKRLRIGTRIALPGGVEVEVVGNQDGRIRVSTRAIDDLSGYLAEHGEVPLPPYIRRPQGPSEDDRERYQTVFARREAAVAAPTAGLHFTESLLERLRAAGIGLAWVTLEVGPATFMPVRTEDLTGYQLDAERASIPAETVQQIRATKSAGGRVVAVGTTTTRTLESRAADPGGLAAGHFEAGAFLSESDQFRVIDGLLTNFHLPKSTLLVLVSAFAGRESVLAAYREAVRRRYRFYSYGDAMLIL